MEARKFRLILAIAVLLATGFVATSLISYYVAQNSLREHLAENTLPLTSDNVYSEIQRDLLRPVFISSVMAQDTFLRDWVLGGEKDAGKITRYLRSIQERYGTVTSYFVSERTRRYYHPSGVLKRVREDDPQDQWYFRVRKMRDDYEINVDHDTADPTNLTIFINYRVYDYDGEFIGSTGVGLALGVVKKLIDTYERRYGRTVYFVDREGNITLHGDAFGAARSLRARPGMEKIATKILTAPGGTFSYERNGSKVFVNSRYVPEFKWLLLVEQSEDAAEERLLDTLVINILVALVTTLVVLLVANMTVGAYQRRLEDMAVKDKLTGALNRQVFDGLLERAMKITERRSSKLSIAMLDVDHFKNVNDTHGHLAGDSVLRAIADSMRRSIRASDVVCRWGGEEFLLLFEACGLAEARGLAEKIRSEIADMVVGHDGQEITVTVSLGVAELNAGESAHSLVDRADQALLVAKRNGRNRVELAE